MSASGYSTKASRITASTLRPLKDNVFVTDLEAGVRLTKGGILLPDDNVTDRGIRARWARVYAIGPDVQDVEVGEWVLVEHGRWTNGMTFEMEDGDVKLWRIDFPAAVLLVSPENPAATAQASL